MIVTSLFNVRKLFLLQVKPVTPGGSGASANFSSKIWYFGAMSRAAAEKILRERARVGEYLVRNSETSVRFVVQAISLCMHC